MNKLLFVLIVLSLAGCATLSREDCMRGDWFGIGIEDGRAGKAVTRFSDHLKACGEYGVTIDNQQYMAGREQGLQEYCRISNAFDSGLRGERYEYVCPPAIDADFRRYNAAAYEVYESRKDLDSIDSDLSSKESRLYDKDLSEESRRQIRQEIRDLDRRRDRLRDDLYRSERELDRLMQEARTRHQL